VTLPFGTALSAESTGATNRRFTSYDRSATTGLDYAINRHFDSQQGRFTQVDPAGMGATSLESPQTLNLYAYCANDPINYTDPSGLGFFSFLKRLFGKVVHAFKAAVVAFVTAFVTGGNFRTARRDAIRAFVSDLGFSTRTWNTPQWNPNAHPIIGGGIGPLSRYIIVNFQAQDPVPDVITFWILESASSRIAALMRRIKQALCRRVPTGRVSGVSGTLGLLGGPTGGVELVQNYRSGQISGFAFGGAQVGWNGGAAGNAYSGFVWGLNDSNSNYSEGFTGVNGSKTFGINAQSSSGGLTGGARGLIPNPRAVTSVSLTAGASLIPTPTGGLTATHYSKPLQMGRWWAQASNPNWIDTPLIVANQVCR
jgi:RHS repeat-associated protein